MISRRDLFIGGACVAAAGAAYALKPRKRQVLLTGAKMAEIVPLQFADWSAEQSDGLVQAKTEGELASRLYSEMVGRIYHQASTSDEVMMLIAYGDNQSDSLQLHRPESCYPAVGFNIQSNVPFDLNVGNGAKVPARKVVASAPGRQENIIYWTRLGEFLPGDSGEQRKVRLETAMRGFIPDGALIRFSVASGDSEAAFRTLEGFIPELISSVAAGRRKALIGTELAKITQA